MAKEHEEMRACIRQAVSDGLDLYEDRAAFASYVENYVMTSIMSNFRSISEIDSIVSAVRMGMRVQVDYYDPDTDDNEYVVKQCW